MDPITDKEDVKYYLGNFFAQQKDYRRAIKAYKAGLRINPNSTILLYEISLAYAKLNKPRRSLQYKRKLLKIAPGGIIACRVREEINK